jgi:deoxyribonuclease-4
MRLGIHTSIAGSLAHSAERAHALGCATFQIFSSSPRQWRASKIDPGQARELERLRQRYDLYPLAIHCNYLVNLASDDPTIRGRSVAGFRGELERAVHIGAEYLILHPGSAKKSGDRNRAISAVVEGLEESARGMRLNGLTILVENTAGGGGSLGFELSEVAELVRRPNLPMGCCLDTAHSYAAGFDLATTTGLAAWSTAVEATIGWDAVRVIHTNDSRAPLGSRRDRHEHIGKGGIGRAGFRGLLQHPALLDKPFILETPIDKNGDDRRNLATVRRLSRKLGTENAGTL